MSPSPVAYGTCFKGFDALTHSIFSKHHTKLTRLAFIHPFHESNMFPRSGPGSHAEVPKPQMAIMFHLRTQIDREDSNIEATVETSASLLGTSASLLVTDALLVVIAPA